MNPVNKKTNEFKNHVVNPPTYKGYVISRYQFKGSDKFEGYNKIESLRFGVNKVKMLEIKSIKIRINEIFGFLFLIYVFIRIKLC